VEVKCPIATRENLEWLLDYGTPRMAAGDQAALERHLTTCAACREMVEGRRAVHSALDLWEAPAVSPVFNRQLYQRIQNETSWRDRLWEPFRWLAAWRGIPAAAAGCLIVAAMIVTPRMLPERPASAPEQPQVIHVESQQPEQVVRDLDDMEMLHNFDRAVHSGPGNAQL
jgi:anti-sigma factor RsiW